LRNSQKVAQRNGGGGGEGGEGGEGGGGGGGKGEGDSLGDSQSLQVRISNATGPIPVRIATGLFEDRIEIIAVVVVDDA